MKTDLGELIRQEETQINQLHAEIHARFPHRHASPQARERWQRACEAFRAYQSPLISYYQMAEQEPVYSSKELLEFVIQFLEIDPYFFRSGYIKEHMLQKLKRALLTEPQKTRLRSLLLHAVLHRGTREYRRYCQLAAALVKPHFVKQIQALTANADPKVSSRAKMMLHILGSRGQLDRQ